MSGRRTDVQNAGGTWVDEPVHVDGMLVTSRKPADLPDFCSAVVDVIASSRRYSRGLRQSAP